MEDATDVNKNSVDNDAQTGFNDSSSQNDVHELRIGMVVPSDEVAYDLYNAYAMNIGFSIRKHKPLWKGKSNVLRGRILVCSRAGKSPNEPDLSDKKFTNVDTRTECPASITFEVVNDNWVITKFNSEHNHEFVQPEQRRFMRSARKITDTSKSIIKSMTTAGIGPTKTYNYLAKEAGGAQNMGFTETDCHNFVQAERANTIGPGDAQSLVNYFKRKMVESPLFFYHVQLDEEGRLSNVFWTDGGARVAYGIYGDVIIFDTTFRTNKYNLVCAPFVGVNNHWKNIYFGCAFLQDETTKSFVWLFETFLEAMGNKAPKTIFTDQDQAMANAIRQVFPNACHRLCTWHIGKNAAQNISHLYSRPGFKEKFNYLLKTCECEKEFESKWSTMINEWGVVDNKWLSKLYDLRHKWSMAFSRGIFSANIRYTQRSESTNNVFQQFSGKTQTLTLFVQHYEDSVFRMREIEKENDYKNARGTLKLSVRGNGILKHAASVYTLRIFKIFEDEFLQCMSCTFEDISTRALDKVYRVHVRGRAIENVVQFCPSDLSIKCDCQKFESMGLLCRHCLFILNYVAGIDRIPSQYIVHRWTKDAKKQMSPVAQNLETGTSERDSKLLRLNNLMRRAFVVMNLCAESNVKTDVGFRLLDHIEEEVHKMDKTSNMGKTSSVNISEDVGEDENYLDDENFIMDPVRKWAKGASRTRKKGALEKRRKRTPTTTRAFEGASTTPPSNTTFYDNLRFNESGIPHDSANLQQAGTSFTSMLQQFEEPLYYPSSQFSNLGDSNTSTSSNWNKPTSNVGNPSSSKG